MIKSATTICSDLRDIEKELEELIIEKGEFLAGALVIDGGILNHEKKGAKSLKSKRATQ
jgi:hypothetical protein